MIINSPSQCAIITVINPTLARVYMSNLQAVYIKLRNDADFKEAFKKNPAAALKDNDITLTPRELKMVLEQNNRSDDELLNGRINK